MNKNSGSPLTPEYCNTTLQLLSCIANESILACDYLQLLCFAANCSHMRRIWTADEFFIHQSFIFPRYDASIVNHLTGVSVMSRWFTLKLLSPVGRIEQYVSILAKNERGARIAFGKRFHVGLASILICYEVNWKCLSSRSQSSLSSPRLCIGYCILGLSDAMQRMVAL